MTKITSEAIISLAALSNISLTDDEVQKYQTEMAAIIAFVEKLNEVDTEDVEITSQVTGLTNVTRVDEIVDTGISDKDLLANAPGQIADYIKVPRVLE